MDDRAAEHRPVCVDERLLCGILGLLRVAQENTAEAEDHPAVPLEEDTRPDAGPVAVRLSRHAPYPRPPPGPELSSSSSSPPWPPP